MIEIPIIEIKNLTVVFNENTPYEVIALKDLTLKIKHGEVLVVTGSNGTGKSTLLNAIAGLIPIKAGQILFNGLDITHMKPIKRAKFIGYVYQDVMLGTCPNLTLHENFQITNTNKWWLPIPYKLCLSQKQIESIKRTSLTSESRTSTKMNIFSGGQRQAIALCLAFENNKPILLCDEFISALDENAISSVLAYTFEQAKTNNTTVLMVLHNISAVEKFSTNFLRL
ncbi:MAG: ATP-binding cassette domain-containing protein [bacterium]